MTAKRKIAFAPPPIDEDSIEAVVRVLRSGWITTGPEVTAFERELGAFLGTRAVCCAGSWTATAELILRWWGVGKGDEVIVPALTYAATANVVLHCGARPVIVDVDPEELVMKPEAIAAALSERTKAIIPVDFAGWPVDMGEIIEVLERPKYHALFCPKGANQKILRRPLVLGDAAHSFGAMWGRGNRAVSTGTQADFTAYSFHAVKNFTTAEGGAVSVGTVWTKEEIADFTTWFRRASLHGQTRSAHQKTTSGGWQYDVLEAGYKCNMTDIQAAIGRAQLKKYRGQLEERFRLAAVYDRVFEEQSNIQTLAREDEKRKGSAHLYIVRLSDDNGPLTVSDRNEIMAKMKKKGIATNVHFRPLGDLSVHRKRGELLASTPHAASYAEQAISLPLHLNMDEDDVTFVAETLIDLLARKGMA